MKNNVVLTGFMGTGKSSVGRLLARRLGFTYRDLDAAVVSSAGKSINEIFAQEGEASFRGAEKAEIRKLSACSRIVLSTGGGAVIDPENRALLKSMGVVVNLTASVDEILLRLKGDSQRPLLREDRSEARLAAMLAEREPWYAEADIRIDTGGKKLEDVAQQILDYLRRIRGWKL
ncbi:MAG TPA: shikimate kinase [Verrucomicrobiae bacterium]|nr:shikimate kinase [Verrucomicrobiae bacterium]